MTQSKVNIFSRSIFTRILFVLERKAYFLIIGAGLHMVSIMPTLLVVNFVYDCTYLFICLFCHLLRGLCYCLPQSLWLFFWGSVTFCIVYFWSSKGEAKKKWVGLSAYTLSWTKSSSSGKVKYWETKDKSRFNEVVQISLTLNSLSLVKRMFLSSWNREGIVHMGLFIPAFGKKGRGQSVLFGICYFSSVFSSN